LGENISQVGWPQCGEIDIMEHINNDTVIYGTMHWDNNGHTQYGTHTPCGVTQYHVYSIEWDQNAIKWFLDSSEYWSANIANNVNSTEEFHNPFYIIFNVAVGGNWPGNPDSTTAFPDTMYVDYVRVYQQANNVRGNLNQNNLINIFPSPSMGKFTIEVPGDQEQRISFEIYNMFGQIICTTPLQKRLKSYEIDLSNSLKGIYFVHQLTDDGKEIFTGKIVIQ
jgi:beta-glucanase (GH16 family)